MSMALLSGFVVTYPINWWLVAKGLKHGMMTVRPRPTAENIRRITASSAPGSGEVSQEPPHNVAHGPLPSRVQISGMAALSIVIFGLAIRLALPH